MLSIWDILNERLKILRGRTRAAEALLSNAQQQAKAQVAVGRSVEMLESPQVSTFISQRLQNTVWTHVKIFTSQNAWKHRIFENACKKHHLCSQIHVYTQIARFLWSKDLDT